MSAQKKSGNLLKAPRMYKVMFVTLVKGDPKAPFSIASEV